MVEMRISRVMFDCSKLRYYIALHKYIQYYFDPKVLFSKTYFGSSTDMEEVTIFHL